MANPQPTDAHLRVAHKINEQLMVSHFTERQRRILDLILRLSWGCGKKTALIPYQRAFEVVGVGEGHVKTQLDWLTEAKVIFRDDNVYSFNKDFDQWRVSRATGYTHQRLTELVSLNLNSNKQNLPKGETKEGIKVYRKGKLQFTEKVNTVDTKSDTPKEWGVGRGGVPPHPPLKKTTTSLSRSSRDQTFENYKEELQLRFPHIDFKVELEKFWLYWEKRKLKNPKLALLNWITRADGFRRENTRPPPRGALAGRRLPSTEELENSLRGAEDGVEN